jgi:phage protein D
MGQTQHYAPYFAIKIGGRTLEHGTTVDVLSVSITDTADRADSFSFSLRERHKKQGRFAGGSELIWMDSDLFDERKQVEIDIGYTGGPAIKFKGEITALSPSFPSSGVPTLSARGFSFYCWLQRGQPRQPFKKVKDSDIARKIAEAVGLGAVVDETEVEYDLVPTNDATYDAFLRKRAQRIGFELVVKLDTLYFQRPRYIEETSPALTLTWGTDLLSFNPSLSTYNMVSEVKTRGSQTSQGKEKRPVVGLAKAGEERGKLGEKTGNEIATETSGENPMLAAGHDLVSQQEARERALAELEARAMNYVQGKGSCIGNPELTARKVIRLGGLGGRFSGDYYVTSTTHTINSSGYRTDFEVKRNAR